MGPSSAPTTVVEVPEFTFSGSNPDVEMKAYLAVTGVLFLALAVAHVARVFVERHLATDPWFIFTTVISVGMALWALRLYRRRIGSQRP